MKRYCNFAMLFFVAYAIHAAPARAGLILDHAPHPYGGPAADTAYLSFGNNAWAEDADDFRLAADAMVTRVVWYGFFGTNFGEGVQPPTSTEIMRIRFHAVRPGDGLPADTICEETITNPQRTSTGRLIGGLGYPERKYQADLATTFHAEVNTDYWLEIVQVGAPESAFRWEYSITPPTNDFAYRANYSPDWGLAGATYGNLSFELWDIPEPASAMLLGSILLIFARTRRRCQ